MGHISVSNRNNNIKNINNNKSNKEQHLAKLTMHAGTKGSDWENRSGSQVDKVNLHPAVWAGWGADLKVVLY